MSLVDLTDSLSLASYCIWLENSGEVHLIKIAVLGNVPWR